MANLTSPESDIHPILSSEMPEVNEGNPAPSSSSSSKDNKASDEMLHFVKAGIVFVPRQRTTLRSKK